MLTIYFIRHCHTDHSPEGTERDQKHLSQLGRQQAIELKKKIQSAGLLFDAIYTSEMPRAIETLIPYLLDENKQYTSIKTLREIKTKMVGTEYFEEVVKNRNFKHPEGESIQEAFNRYQETINTIIEKHPEGTIAIVTHGMIFRSFISHIYNIDFTDRKRKFSNPDVYKIQYQAGEFLPYQKCEELLPENTIIREHS